MLKKMFISKEQGGSRCDRDGQDTSICLFLYMVLTFICTNVPSIQKYQNLKDAIKESKTHSRETEQPREDLAMTDDRTIRENFKIMD